MFTKEDIIMYQDLIGLRIKVISHTDPSFVNIRGTVIDETMNILIIQVEHNHKRIRIPKLYGIFELELPSGERILIDGTLIHGRPEDRLKRMLRR